MTAETVADHQQLSPLPRPQARAGVSFKQPLAWLIAGVFAVIVAIALVVALTAVLFVGAMVAIAALVLRLSPRRAAQSTPTELEGRRTPDGWVVEAALRR